MARVAGRALFATLLLLSLPSCAESLAWVLTFNPPELEDELDVLEASIQRGACTGGEEVYRVAIRPGEPAMDVGPPELEEGLYCFSGHAKNRGCEVYAAGERLVELPAEEVIVALTALDPPTSLCAPSERCLDGQCAPACPSMTANCDEEQPDCETDLRTSAQHCGGCGTVCGMSEECVEGECCVFGTGGGGGLPCLRSMR